MSKKKVVAQKKPISNACCVYDFTLFDEIGTPKVREILGKLCKKYCFQIEKGEKTGIVHFQGRFSLKVKKRKMELIKILNDYWDKYHISITSNENKGNHFYVMKEDTRIEGPFTDENEIFVPDDVKIMHTLYPWQESLRNMLKTYDPRTVDVVFEQKGNLGKSSLSRYMMTYDDAEEIPYANDFKDIMRFAYDIGPKKIYLVDMPRALYGEKLNQFFAGIEKLKSGYCYDDRYKFQRRLFNRPRICMFTNVKPNLSLLSKDMWKIWEIEENQLVPYMEEKDKPEIIKVHPEDDTIDVMFDTSEIEKDDLLSESTNHDFDFLDDISEVKPRKKMY